jgi:MFS family permease
LSQIVSNTWHPVTRLVPISMRYGQFRYYWLALVAGVTGHQMLLNFTMGWLLFDLTGQERDLAFLGIAIAVPAIALNVVGGVLADRFEPKVLVAVAQSTSATVVVLLAVMVMLGRVEPAHVLIAAVLIGTVQAFDQPSRSSIFPRLVQREHIVNAVAMESLVWNGVRVLAPALAGIMIEQVSIQASMFFSAATFYVLGSVVALLKLRDRAPATGQVTQQVMEGIRYVRTHTVFFLVMLLTFCNSLFGMAYVHLMPSFAKEVLGVDAGSVGYLLGASGLGAIIGTLIIARLKDHHPKGLIIIGGAITYGVFLILFSLAAWRGLYMVSVVALLMVGISNSLYLTGGLSVLQHLVPDRLRGRVMGLYGMTWSLAPLGMAQAGFVAQYTNASVAVAAGAVVTIVVAGLILLLSPAIRALRGAIPESQRLAYQSAGVPAER